MRNLVLGTGLLLLSACSGEPMSDEPSDAGQLSDASSDAGSIPEPDADATVDVGADSGSDLEERDRPPTAVDDRFAILPGAVARLDVLANDLEPDGEPLNVESITEPERGTARLVDGALEYTSADRAAGYDALSYTISDPGGATSTATVHVTTYDAAEDGAPTVRLPTPPGLTPAELAIVINEADAYSVAVGEYYATSRGIPAENVVRISIPTTDAVLDPMDFAPLKAAVDSALSEDVEALALAWIAPYRVGCMSMTSAFALGFDEMYCGIGAGCQPSAPVDYYDSYSESPHADHGLRPSMMLALTNEADAMALIDRGVESDATFPLSTGYLYRTTDAARSVRFPDLAALPDRWSFEMGLTLDYVDNSDGSGSNTLQDATDVLFYFTGLTAVSGLDTLTFLPGAVADHLTSFGGRLTSTSGQMSIVRWLEAGATGSFGTVVEPCNYQQKFPRVSVFLDHYYRGETLIEAYWKSVNWPGEGVFIGEPLARPYGRSFLSYEDGALVIGTSWLIPNTDYEVVAADDSEGPYERVGDVIRRTNVGFETIVMTAPAYEFYELRRID